MRLRIEPGLDNTYADVFTDDTDLGCVMAHAAGYVGCLADAPYSTRAYASISDAAVALARLHELVIAGPA